MARVETCPFIERSEPRCAKRLNLGQLGEAFRLCVACPTACAIYHELRWRERSRGTSRGVVVVC
jgi:hypothetical protein